MGGMGYTGASSGRNDDVPHFNFDKHRMQQERRRKRAANAEDYGFIAPGMVLPLVGVGTLLVFAYTVASQDDRNKSRGPRA